MKEEFLQDISKQISRARTWQRRYKITYIMLTSSITVSGFMTAASTNEALQSLPLFGPGYVLFYGLASAVGAILIQTLSPQEKHLYHRSLKHELINISNAVKFKNLQIDEAQDLRANLRGTLKGGNAK